MEEKDINNQNNLETSDMELLGDTDIFGDDAISPDTVPEEKPAEELTEESKEDIQENLEEEIEISEKEISETQESSLEETIPPKEETQNNFEQSLFEEYEETNQAPKESIEKKESDVDKNTIPIVEAVTFEDVENSDNSNELVTVRPIRFQSFENLNVNKAMKRNLDILQDVSMHVSVELGKAKSTIKEVMDIKKGSIIELTKIAGEQVEVYINDKYVAKGEVIVIEDKFGIRVTNTNIQKK